MAAGSDDDSNARSGWSTPSSSSPGLRSGASLPLASPSSARASIAAGQSVAQSWAVDRASSSMLATAGEIYACTHAERCGGCPMIHLGYGDQLGLKRGRVVQAAARFGALELLYTEPVVPAEAVLGYRTRAKLMVAPRARIGLFAKGGGHQVVDIPNCLVLSPTLLSAVAQLRTLIEDDEANGGLLAPYDPSGTGALRAIDVREAYTQTGTGLLLTLVLQRSRSERDLLRYRAVGERLLTFVPKLRGVAINLHDGVSPQVLGGETHAVAGESSLPDSLGSIAHEATFGSFVQANRLQAQRIHQLLVGMLGLDNGERDPATGAARKHALRVLDLYGGSGAIALSLAAAGAEVTLVETYAPAAAQAERAAARAGLQLHAICSDVGVALGALQQAGSGFDAAVVNPPRRGMSSTAREHLARLAPASIAYVSCSPETLMRDLDHLSRLGYASSRLTPFDMIPLTDEVETVTLLRRTTQATPRILYEDDDILVVEKSCHEPVTPRREYLTSLQARTRQLHGAEDATAAHEIDAGISGIAVFARTRAAAELWRAALAAPSARRVYVGAARGLTPHKGTISRPLRDGAANLPARSRFRRLAIAAGHSILRIVPEESRNHQVRRHLASFGHPIIGDERYGHAPTNRFFEEKFGLDRSFLHCVRLELEHPVSGVRIHFEAPIPGELRSVLERAGSPDAVRALDHKNALGLSSIPPAPESHAGESNAGDARGVDLSSVRLRIPQLSPFLSELPSAPALDERERPTPSDLQDDDDDPVSNDA